LGLRGKVLVAGAAACRAGFCKKMPEAIPMSDGASSSWLQDGPAAGQNLAHQQQW